MNNETRMPTIGWSKFARERHRPGSGNTYTTLEEQYVVQMAELFWDGRQPGHGETGLDRKVVIPVKDAVGFFLPTAKLEEDLPLRAHATRRQAGEDLHVEVFLDSEDAKRFKIEPEIAKFVKIVCYSADALLENNGERSTDCDWEIVAILGSKAEQEPMTPLTMARNFLEKPGGTKSEYTAKEFAEAIYYHSQRGIKIKSPPMPETGAALAQAIQHAKAECDAANQRLYRLKKGCPHKLRSLTEEELADQWMSVGARCMICSEHFGWRCKISPDGVCHYCLEPKNDVLGIYLVDGSFRPVAELPPHRESSGMCIFCIFCSMPDERK